ncbi:MAG: hypothetical protein ABIY35_00430, partial [Chitinophagaceae bacterium]
MKKLQLPHYLQMITKHGKIFFLLLIIGFSACKNSHTSSVLDAKFEGTGDDLQTVTQQLVAPPMLPKFDQVDNEDPKVVQVTLTVIEKKIEVAPGDSIWAFTYNGTVPGPMIVVHQNDFVELTLKNP